VFSTVPALVISADASVARCTARRRAPARR
jgi:hypothetical protein